MRKMVGLSLFEARTKLKVVQCLLKRPAGLPYLFTSWTQWTFRGSTARLGVTNLPKSKQELAAHNYLQLVALGCNSLLLPVKCTNSIDCI